MGVLIVTRERERERERERVRERERQRESERERALWIYLNDFHYNKSFYTICSGYGRGGGYKSG